MAQECERICFHEVVSFPVVFVQLLSQGLKIEGGIAGRRVWLRRRHDFSGVGIKLVGCGCFKKEEEEAVDCGHAFGPEELDEYKAESDDSIPLGSTVEDQVVMQVCKANHLRNHCSI